ncbi:phosphoribosyl-ATP diphosphatase [Apibacter sp.]|uniref:phosphoribosyl-ATP diphosphatase n=1 Tax=Apibacter sp. TaxID=2023709 RepID=UPI0025E95676|nr:phosphoribosyl-ATP diphosphatase [Apibacter sp.]MCT6868596.1 phosphoribosyl-ATP diphosphatase [Apibacter sp.]
MKDTNFSKEKGIITIIQDNKTGKVLASGISTDTLIKKSQLERKIYLNDVSYDDLYIWEECFWNKDKSVILIKVKANKDSEKYIITTDFAEENKNSYSYLSSLEKKIGKSIKGEKQNTHITTVLKKGKSKIAQKFGEEAVELVIEAARENDKLFKDEAADVFYYYLILLQERGFLLDDILKQLKLQKRKI